VDVNPIHPNMTVWAAFRTKDPAPHLPPELDGAVAVDHDVGRYHADAKSEIRVALHVVGPDRAVRALRKCGVRVARHFLTVDYSGGFWDDPPADCAGALLASDGYVALPDATLNWRIVPLSEPLYTIGRPEADSEHSRFKPHVLSHKGGVQVVSDELLATLRNLGAEGQTAPIIYRGFNKKAYDTVQPGFRRFLPQPEYQMRYTGGIEFLPTGVPREFGICSMLRIPKGLPETIPGIQRNLAEDRWYDIALALDACQELRRLRRSVLLTPMFSRGGETDSWVSTLESAVEELQA
jgi:hypothetical protein